MRKENEKALINQLVMRTQAATSLVREKGINGRVLNLLSSEPGIIPPTPRDPLGLGNLQKFTSNSPKIKRLRKKNEIKASITSAQRRFYVNCNKPTMTVDKHLKRQCYG